VFVHAQSDPEVLHPLFQISFVDRLLEVHYWISIGSDGHGLIVRFTIWNPQPAMFQEVRSLRFGEMVVLHVLMFACNVFAVTVTI
jgi:hypothetical protein